MIILEFLKKNSSTFPTWDSILRSFIWRLSGRTPVQPQFENYFCPSIPTFAKNMSLPRIASDLICCQQPQINHLKVILFCCTFLLHSHHSKVEIQQDGLIQFIIGLELFDYITVQPSSLNKMVWLHATIQENYGPVQTKSKWIGLNCV